MKIKLFVVLLLAIALSGYSKPVSQNDAAKFAVNFYKSQYYRLNKSLPSCIISGIESKSVDGQTAYFIVNIDNGFVIVSADDQLFPVIGYSFEGNLNNNIPESLSFWLNQLGNQVVSVKKTVSDQPNEVWTKFLDMKNVKDGEVLKSVGPLLTTKWDQDSPYNMYCPEHPSGPGGHCYAGCVATAMGQVMKYHNYPEHGTGSKTYMWGIEYTVNFDTTYYRWDEMSNTATSQSKYAIAELLLQCGVSVDMNYSYDGSSSHSNWVPDALKNYFGYHPSVRYKSRSSMSDEEWDMLIRDNIDVNRPMVYSGSDASLGEGHAWVCDGYQDTCFYHFNWGWSGSGNGYFYYNTLTVSSYDFTDGQGAVVDIFPYFGDYCVSGHTLIEPTRTFEDGSGNSYYWNNTNCSWLIAPQNAENINIVFTSFQTEAGADILYVYDGENNSAPLLGQYSGSQIPEAITTTGSKAYLEFVTDGQNQYQGWSIAYVADVTGVDESALDKNLLIYPNPASENISLYYTGNELVDAAISLTNLSGQNLLNKNVQLNSGSVIPVNVSELPEGLYFLTVKTNGGISNHKIIVQ